MSLHQKHLTIAPYSWYYSKYMPNEISNNIYNILLEMKSQMGGLETMTKLQTIQLRSIEEQTKKTNGRVTKLEDFVTQQLQINSRIEGLYKASTENTKIQIQNMEDKSKREIDEFKKQDTDIIKLDKENSSKLMLAIWSTFSIILIALAGWLFNKSGDNQLLQEIAKQQAINKQETNNK